MTTAEIFRQYVEHLFAGKRCEAREMLLAAQDRGIPAAKLIKSVIWPAMEQVDKLYRNHHISRIVEHMATRINRMLADQLQALMARKPKNGRRIIVTCGDGDIEELGAQITADMFEAEGWSVWFIGSCVPNDEILQFVGKLRPDVMCIYGAQPASVPGIRKLIETVRGVGVCQDMQILVSGGVFNRADGLCDEVKADLFAGSVTDAIQAIEDHPTRVAKPDVPEPGRRRKRRTAVASNMKKSHLAMSA
jgi:methanogenic corrinoid protein MtbC1